MDNDNDKVYDKPLYSEKALYCLNIKELRDMGRKFGVPSPTTKSKKDLVDYILKIVYGEVEVPVRNIYGRHSVREFDMDNYLDKIKKHSNIAEDILNFNINSGLGSMVLSSESSPYKTGDDIQTRVYFQDGEDRYLRVREFISSPDDIKVSKEMAEKFNLENFDVLEIIQNDNLFKIISINGIKVSGKSNNIVVNDEVVQGGTYKVFYLSTKEEVKENITSISKSLEDSDLKLLLFSSNEYKIKTALNISYSLSEGYPKIYKKFMYFISQCEQAIYNNENLVIVVEDFEDIEDMATSFEPDVSARVKNFINSIIPKFVSIGNTFVSFKIIKSVNY